jgi:hypothetical protein
MSEAPRGREEMPIGLTPPALGAGPHAPIGLPYDYADAANNISGLHKLLHCVGDGGRARWRHAGINRFLPGHILCGDHRHHRFHRLESIVARSARVKRAANIA